MQSTLTHAERVEQMVEQKMREIGPLSPFDGPTVKANIRQDWYRHFDRQLLKQLQPEAT